MNRRLVLMFLVVCELMLSRSWESSMLYRSVVLVVKSTKLLHALIIASMLVIYEYASNLKAVES